MAQAILEFDAHPADRAVGFELGWDFAHHALTPPLDDLAAGSPLRPGWDAGRACFGARTLAPSRHVRKWLQLRLEAWRRGLVFEGVQVTPNYLRQIDVAWCPVTRLALTHDSCSPGDASGDAGPLPTRPSALSGGNQRSEAGVSCINRVRDDAGYAAGNLAVMSTRAHAAKGRRGFDDALTLMRLAEASAAAPPGYATLAGLDELCGLGGAEWARLAVLCSFVTALSHAQAAGLPMLVLPPNRLRLFNPVQALQALVTRQFGQDGWSGRIARIETLLAGKPIRRDFQRFVRALLPRVLESGRRSDAQAMRWALEDAWRNPLVLRCWSRFAEQLSAAQAEQVVVRASALRLGQQRSQAFTLAEATEDWALARGGFVTLPARRHPAATRAHPVLSRNVPLPLALGA